MRAYNERWIYNRNILEQAERWYRQHLLSDEQIATVRQAYPVAFRQTNGFIEIGLFLFTTVAILAAYLLPSSVFSTLLADQKTYCLFNVAFGVGVGIIGQLLINRRLLYRNGIDNAFVVTLTGFLAFGLNQFLPNGLSVATHCLVTLPLLLLLLWYYGDTLLAFFTLVTFYTFMFDSLLRLGWRKDNGLPFALMGVSLILYLCLRQLVRSYPKQVYYTDPLNLAQWISLVMLAANGNYFVVRELNGVLLKPSLIGAGPTAAPEISLPWLFWGLTFLIPTLYLWQGLQKKNRMLIILGALGWIAAMMTVHEYVGLVPLNLALALGGLMLLSLAVAGIQYLRPGLPDRSTRGFTDKPDDDSPDEFLSTMGTLTSMQATTETQHTPQNDMRFGEGNFGGAGSEGTY